MFFIKNFTKNFLHRWKFVSYNCEKKIENCLSMKWEDYNLDRKFIK